MNLINIKLNRFDSHFKATTIVKHVFPWSMLFCFVLFCYRLVYHLCSSHQHCFYSGTGLIMARLIFWKCSNFLVCGKSAFFAILFSHFDSSQIYDTNLENKIICYYELSRVIWGKWRKMVKLLFHQHVCSDKLLGTYFLPTPTISTGAQIRWDSP